MLFWRILGYFTLFLRTCDVTEQSKKLEFYKSDLIIIFFVHKNLLIEIAWNLASFFTHFMLFWDILQRFSEACDVINEPQNLWFYKSDVNIRFFVQVNLFIQYLKHFTDFLPFSAILTYSGVLYRPHLESVTSLMEKNWNLTFMTSSLGFLSRQPQPFQI